MFNELQRRFREAPRYQRVLFVTHLMARGLLLILGGVAVIARLLTGQLFPWILVWFVPWFLFRQVYASCVAYRCRHDPAFHYGLQNADRGYASFEVLEDGTTISVHERLRADPFPIRPAGSAGTSWHDDWLRRWLETNTDVNSLLRRIPGTAFISRSIDTVQKYTVVAVGLGFLFLFTVIAPLVWRSSGLALLAMFFVTIAYSRIARLRNFTSADRIDGFWDAQTWSQRLAAALWKLCSCERLHRGQFPTSRPRERRNLG